MRDPLELELASSTSRLSNALTHVEECLRYISGVEVAGVEYAFGSGGMRSHVLSGYQCIKAVPFRGGLGPFH